MLRITTWGMLAFLLAFPIAMNMTSAGAETLPGGARVGDVPVGGLTPAVAKETVARRAADLAAQPMHLELGGRMWTPLPTELGIAYDVDGSTDALLAVGDTPSFQVPLRITFEEQVFDTWLDERLAELGPTATDAGVVIDGLTASVVPASDGLGLDEDALLTDVLRQVAALEPVSAVADVGMRPAEITTGEAEAAKTQVDLALAEPWVLNDGVESWTLEPATLAPALRVAPTDDGALELTWDVPSLQSAVDELATQVYAGPADARVEDLSTKSWLVPASPGRQLDHKKLIADLHDALRTGSHTLTLAVTPIDTSVKSTVQAMEELGLTDVLGVGSSIYEGSGPGRTNNVEVAAYMVDGTLVAPGEIFSFNAAVGSLFNGMYMDAGSYIDGPNGQSLGGGVCQVSTTVFRAALNAGLPIVEWWPHSYRSPFYELGDWSPGFDAAIVQDSLSPEQSTDLRFENTTGGWLLVSATTEHGQLKVEIRGADPGYAVSFDEPNVEVVEWATSEVSVVVDEQLPPGTSSEQAPMDGLQVTVVRYVHDRTGELISQDTFVSTYGSYGGILRLSPDMAETAGAE